MVICFSPTFCPITEVSIKGEKKGGEKHSRDPHVVRLLTSISPIMYLLFHYSKPQPL